VGGIRKNFAIAIRNFLKAGRRSNDRGVGPRPPVCYSPGLTPARAPVGLPEVIVSEVILAEMGLSEVIVSVVIMTEAGLSEMVMSVIVVSEVIMPEMGLSGIGRPVMVVMPVLIDIPAIPVPHPIEPGPLRAIQAAVGPHPGRGGVNATLLIFQAAKFPGSQLSRLYTLVDATLLSHLPLAEVGAAGLRPGGKACQDDPTGQQAGHDAFSQDSHWFILQN
jgi:hypothetical protein